MILVSSSRPKSLTIWYTRDTGEFKSSLWTWGKRLVHSLGHRVDGKGVDVRTQAACVCSLCDRSSRPERTCYGEDVKLHL